MTNANCAVHKLASLMRDFFQHLHKATDTDCIDGTCLRLAGEMLELFKTIPDPKTVMASPAGRKRTHDRDWAVSCMIDIAIRDPDGLPSTQNRMIESLRDRFTSAGKTAPGDTWLKSMVRDFYQQATRFETKTVEEYRKSPDLQMVFPTEASFISFRRSRDAIKTWWKRSPDLQSRFPSVDDFVLAVFRGEASHQS